MARLAMLVQGLRSHPLHEIYRIDFATASRAGDCFTASPPNQPWVRNDDKNKVVIGRLAWFVGGLRSCPLVVCDRMDPVLVPRAGDRFTPCRSQHAGFAMTKKQKYVIGRAHVFQTHAIGIPTGPCCNDVY